MSNILSLIGVIGTVVVSIWAVFKYVVLGAYSLNSEVAKRLIIRVEKDAAWHWVLDSEHVEEPKFPRLYQVLAVIDGVPFFLARNERLLTAGWQGKEDVNTVTFFRWHRRRIDKVVRSHPSLGTVPISALGPNGSDRLGELATDPGATVYLNEGSYEDIEKEVVDVVLGRRSKTGCLLHGEPGNGKSQFVKYLARKYSLPVYVVCLRPDYDNVDFLRMFSEIPRRCIVLMEDFDNYFHGRECVMKNEQVRFTYDAIINALDGVHNDYRGVVFIMTVNDLGKVDPAIKERPSRFKFVREFKRPDKDLRARILGEDQADETEGLSLDQIFSRRSSF